MRTVLDHKRGCGYRKEGGLYLMAGTEQSEFGTLPVFVLINPPIPYNVPVHRGARMVDDTAVLNREPLDNWWIGSSKKTEEKKDAEQWAQETFGMSIYARINVGECAGAKDPDAAIQILADKVALRVSLASVAVLLQEVTRSGIQEQPRAAIHFNQLHQNMVSFIENKDKKSLLAVAAATWRLAFILAPTKRETYIPTLQRILISINLVKDAACMKAVLGV